MVDDVLNRISTCGKDNQLEVILIQIKVTQVFIDKKIGRHTKCIIQGNIGYPIAVTSLRKKEYGHFSVIIIKIDYIINIVCINADISYLHRNDPFGTVRSINTNLVSLDSKSRKCI